MEKLIEHAKLMNRFSCDSAGTGGWHVGEPADSRMQRHAAKRGYTLHSRARQFIRDDFEEFDLILAMDPTNYRDIMRLDSQNRFSDKVQLMTDFCREHSVDEVPDPYYGGDAGFEKVLDILEDACEGLMSQLKDAG